MHEHPQKWLSIIGIGDEGFESLSPAARILVDQAKHILGGKRHLEMLPPNHPATRMTWKVPLLDTVEDLRRLQGEPVVVLATGDPMSYGIGVTLGREFGYDGLTVMPVPGAFSLSAAKLGWPIQDVVCMTLHGRPLELLGAELYPRARLFILSENGTTPKKVADYVTERGFGASQIHILEHLGGEKENHHQFIAKDIEDQTFADLNTLALDIAVEEGQIPMVLSRAAGLPDDAFEHDGQMTKREVRAATIAALAPQPGQLLWDLGAGCGSVAIEWMRLGGEAVGVERDDVRVGKMARNAVALSVPHLDIRHASHMDILDDLPDPQAVFIGGGLKDFGLAQAVYDRLPKGGRLVANSVTLEGEIILQQMHEKWGGQLGRIAVSRLHPVGGFHGWKPFMPVTQYQIVKGWG